MDLNMKITDNQDNSSQKDIPRVLVITDPAGDTRQSWRPDSPEEIDAARDLFDAKRASGYIAYRADQKGALKEIIREFDPLAEMIILSPPLLGG